MAQVLRPENIGAISKVSNTILSIGASLAIIGGQQRQTSTINITTSTLGMNGIDTGAIAINQFYYVYLVINNGVTGGVISLSASAPTGFPAYKLVGQCTTDGSAFLVAADKILTNDTPIGHVMSAMLSEPQFRAIHGSGWILADGRSVASSKYQTITGETNAPDLRGMILRGKNNGRADGNQDLGGERVLGNFQGEATKRPTTAFTMSNGVVTGSGVGGNGGSWVTGYGSRTTSDGGGDAETRPKNIAVNHFIKINP